MATKGYSIKLGGTVFDNAGEKMASVDYEWVGMDYETATMFEMALNDAINNVCKQFGQAGIALKKQGK